MKTALKRLSSSVEEVLSAVGDIEVKTIVLANTSSKNVHCTVYMDQSSSFENRVVFSGNIYPNTNISVYLSKDIQLYLRAGDVLLAEASYLDGTSLSSDVVDMIISYEGLSSEVGSSSSSSEPSVFKNYNRSTSKLSSHVNWGLLRSAIPANYSNWGSA